jgi:hypothetical protein
MWRKPPQRLSQFCIADSPNARAVTEAATLSLKTSNQNPVRPSAH